MNRRQFVAFAGTTPFVSRAGARTGEERSDDGTPVAEATDVQEEPAFELVEVDAPDGVGIDEEFSFEVTVANPSERDRRFVSPITVTAFDEEMWRAGLIDIEIPGGEEVTYRNDSVTFPYVGEVTFRISVLDETFAVEAEAATLAFGDPLVTPADILLSVRDVELTTTYQYEGTDGTQETHAEEGSQWAFIRIGTTNLADERQSLPRSWDLNLIVDDQQFEEAYVRKEADKYQSSEVNPGISREGWIAYELPADVELADLVVSYSDSDITGEWVGNWRASDTGQSGE